MKAFIYKHILTKPLWQNMLYGFGLIIFLLLIFVLSLNAITRFNKILKVPNIVGQNKITAIKMLSDAGFNVEIQDSIYVDSLSKIAVVKQNPESDEMVKYGRTIFLTINRVKPPDVEMPNLIGFSLESAIQYLKSIGLKVNQILYRNNDAFNIVLSSLYKGNNIDPGTKLFAGVGIDLIVGNGNSIIEMDVPNLIGLNVSLAMQQMQSMNLKIGNITANSIIIDTNAAYIIEQNPPTLSNLIDTLGGFLKNKIKTWQKIDIVISNEPKLNDSLK